MEESEEEDNEYGNWLSTSQVKTIEGILVVCKDGWIESTMQEKKRPAAGAHKVRSVASDSTNFGKSKSAEFPQRFSDRLGERIIAHNEAIIVDCNEPGKSRNDKGEMSAANSFFNDKNNVGPSANLSNQELIGANNGLGMPWRKSISIHRAKYELAQSSREPKLFIGLDSGSKDHRGYRVEYPSDEEDNSKAIVPFNGPSTMSTVIMGLNEISLKRSREETPDPFEIVRKRRLTCEKSLDGMICENTPTEKGRKPKRSYRTLKQLLRCNKRNA